MKAAVMERAIEQQYVKLLQEALYILKRPYDAEDAVQTACLKAWLHQQDVFSEQACLPWLRKIVFHECVLILRKRSRAVVLMSYDEMAAKSAARDDEPDFVQAVIVKGAISTLADQYATPLRLRYYEGLSIAEIAQQMGVPPGTVNSRMYRGKRMLEKELDEMIDDIPIIVDQLCQI